MANGNHCQFIMEPTRPDISLVGRSRISYLPKMPVSQTENIHVSRCDMLSGGYNIHQGIHDGPKKFRHRSTIVEQRFIMMSWSKKIYLNQRSQKHWRWNPVRNVIYYSKMNTNLLPERARAFSVFHPEACALAD